MRTILQYLVRGDIGMLRFQEIADAFGGKEASNVLGEEL
jgi:hypothetical protein